MLRARSTRGLSAVATTCLLAVATNGCSFLFSEGPPPDHRELRYFDCDSTYFLPATDAFLGAWGVGVLVASAFNPYAPAPVGPDGAPAGPSSGTPVSALLLLGAATLVPLTSAVYGYKKMGSCRDAKAELAVRLNTSSGGGPPVAP
jgi:hypothetical protein